MTTSRVQEIKDLLSQVQEQGSYRQARRITDKIARRVKRIEQTSSDRSEIADAFRWYALAVQNLATLSRNKNIKARVTALGYELESHAVDLILQGKRGLDDLFAVYNLGIDLIVNNKQAIPAKRYLLAARAIFNQLPKRTLLHDFRLNINYGLAACEKQLGNAEKAARILRATLGRKRVNMSNWIELKAFGQCVELLAQILVRKEMGK